MFLIILGIFLAVVVCFGLWAVATYNNLIHQSNMLSESLSGIAVQQKQRYDLIPNLVNTVSGYSVHEKELLSSIASLRASAMQSTSPTQAASIENNLTGALHSLFAVVENYPELKANQGFLKLQDSLSKIETELQLARRYYNAVARNYNTAITTFPSVLVASLCKYEKAAFFVLDNQVQAEAPVVKF